MVSRKGAILVTGESGLLTLGSLVFATLWVISVLKDSGSSMIFDPTHFQTDHNPLLEWIKLHTGTLSVLGVVAGPLGTGGAFFLGLALLQPGLTSLVRGQASVSAGTIRWLAILGLLSTLLAVLGSVTLALIDQVLGFPPPGGIFLLIVKTPLLWLGLLGFCAVLWGSFLRSQPVGSALGPTP